jgi:ATP-dependent Clp protease ATP-binding subunit ClpC
MLVIDIIRNISYNYKKKETMIDSPENEGKGKSSKSNSDSSTPVLDNFSKDLIKLAEQGKLDPVVGREKEITRIAQILSRRKKNNPIIIGEPGCGKTAIAEGLAIKIFNGDCPRNLQDKRIVSLEMTSVVAGTKYRGQFEERMKVIIEELQSNPNIILFIDEIHTIVGAGNSSGSLDASNIFKPALSRGEIQCIGATTLDEYRKNFEKDGALERRFQKVLVDSATKEETFQILKNVKDRYENFHKVSYSDEVLMACVELAERYITDREFPDKAFDIVDEVGARCQVEIKMPEAIEKLKLQAQEIKLEKIDVVKQQNYEEAANLRDKEKRILNKLDQEKKKFEEELTLQKREIPIELVFDVVSNMTKIPVSKLNADEKSSLANLEKDLAERVIGQDNAVSKIAKSIRRNRLGIKDPNKPIGSFIFLGSTGVGKTYLAKQLAKQIFGSEDNLIRIDMSEYQEKHTISRMIGSPSGYVGYEDGGQLTEQVKNKPYSVILFDEVEKAHKDIYSLLLQVLDDGYLTDSLGRKINFKNSVIIMTTNIGVRKVQEFGAGIGFGTKNKTYVEEELKKDVLKKELQKFFAPEFLNRVDEIIVFNTLVRENVKKIVSVELDRLLLRLKGLKYNFTFDDSIIEMIAEVGFDELYGARPLKRAIQDKIEDFISEEVLKGNINEGGVYTLICENDEVKFKLIENVSDEVKPTKKGRKKKGE